MNQNDGSEILKVLEEFINIELSAGNRITKNNGSYILNIISAKIKEIFSRDTNKEKLWEEQGKAWLKKQK